MAPSVCQIASVRVKNTFIDEAKSFEDDVDELPKQPSARRCVTEPLPRHEFLKVEMDTDGDESTVASTSDEEQESPGLGLVSVHPKCGAMPAWPRTMSGDALADFLDHMNSKPGEVEMHKLPAEWPSNTIALPDWPRTMSGDDLADFLSLVSPAEQSHCSLSPPSPPEAPRTLCFENFLVMESALPSCFSEVGPVKSLTSNSTSPGDHQSELARMVQQECTFLRITSCTLMPLAPRSAKKIKRGTPQGVTRCLRICAEGLPSLKRQKWMQPLAERVAGLLERKQCPALVRRGELFASLDTTESGELVCVDLCASRVSDEY